MPIGLTAKIEPKNDGFVGMVDADQVIGASGNGGYLPSSAISGIREYQLKVSNSPSDGYFLQYKDSSDQLTWAETSTTDVAWSGASEYIGHSSNTSIHYPSSEIKTWTDSLYAQSGAVGGISSWYDLSTGTGIESFGGSVSISGTQAETISVKGYSTISSNAQKAQASAQVALYSETFSSESDLTDLLDDNYQASGVAGTAAGSNKQVQYNNDGKLGASPYFTFEEFTGVVISGGHVLAFDDPNLYNIGLDKFGNTTNFWIEVPNNTLKYDVSGNLSLSFSQKTTSIGDHDFCYIWPSGYQNYGRLYVTTGSANPTKWHKLLIEGEEGTDVSWSGASGYYVVSSLVSNLNAWYNNSSQQYSKAYASAQRVKDLFDHTLYATSANIYNKTWIDTLSGSIDTRLDSLEGQEPSSWSGAADFYGFSSNVNSDITSLYSTSSAHDSRLDTLEGYDQFDHTIYQTSSSAISRYADSSNYSTHKSDSSIHFTKVSIDDDYAGSGAFQSHKNDEDIHFPSSNLTEWLNSIYQQSGSVGSDVAWSGASDFYGFSSNAKSLYHPSGYGTFSYLSSQTLSGGTITTNSLIMNANQISGIAAPTYNSGVANKKYVDDISGAIVSHVSDNYYTKTWIDSYSGSVDSRLDTLEGQEPTSWSGASGYLGHSGNTDVHVSTTENANWNQAYDWVSASSQRYENILSSGTKYSQAYASAQIAIYSETYSSEGDLTSVLNDNYHPSGYVISGSEYSQAYASAQIALYDTTFDWISSQKISGGSILSKLVEGLDTPTESDHAANKAYVDNAVSDSTYWYVEPQNTQVAKDGSNRIYFSGQGLVYVYSGQGQANTIIFSAQTQSAGNLSDLNINADKDWSGYGIHNLAYISASTISGGIIVTDSITIDANTISGLAAPTYNSGAANKKYVDDISGAIVTHVTNNYYTQSWIDTFSGSIDTRLDSLEGQEPTSWSGAADFYGFSSNIDSRVDSLYDWSSNALNLYGASSHSHDDLYYTETEVDTISGSIVTHVSNNYYTKTWVDSLSGSIDSRLDTLEGYDQFDHTLYQASTSAISRFADSSNYSTHKSDSSIHFTKASIDDDYAGSGAFQTHKDDGDIHFPSSNLTGWLDSVYQPSGTGGAGGSGQNYAYKYIVYRDGSNFKAQNGTTANIDIEDTDATTVLQYALNKCSSQLPIVDEPGGYAYMRRGGTTKLGSNIGIVSTVSGTQGATLDLGGYTLSGITTDMKMVKMMQGFIVMNGMFDFMTLDSNDAACIWFDGDNYIHGKYGPQGLSNLFLMGPNPTLGTTTRSGTGILMETDSDDGCIGGVVIDNVKTRLFRYGIRMEANHGTPGNTNYINCNMISNYYDEISSYPIYTHTNAANSTAVVAGNTFSNITLQGGVGSTIMAIWLSGNSKSNIFNGTYIWDTDTGIGIRLHDDTSKNHFQVNCNISKFKDSGTYNTYDAWDSAGVNRQQKVHRLTPSTTDGILITGYKIPSSDETAKDARLVLWNSGYNTPSGSELQFRVRSAMNDGAYISYLDNSTTANEGLELGVIQEYVKTPAMFIQRDTSNIRIGTSNTPTNYRLEVDGGILAYGISSQVISGGSIRNHMPSSQFRGWLDSVYQQSGAVGSDVAWSGASEFYAFSSNVKSDITDLFSTSSSHDSRLDTLEGYDVFDHTSYITSSNAIDRFAGSSNYSTHKADDDIHFPSSSITPWLDGVYQQSGATGFDSSWSGTAEFYAVSSLVNTLDTWYDASSSKYSNAYASASIALYEETYSNESDLTSVLDDNYHPSGYVISGSEYSQAYASAQIALYSETYSSEGDLTSVLDDNYHPSGYVISGAEYSQAYASAQVALYDTYFDFVSSQNISGGTILATVVTGLDTPSDNSDAANKAYVDDAVSDSTYWYVEPQNTEVAKDGENKIFFSGQGLVYVYSGQGQPNTIIFSAQSASAGNLSDLTINDNKDWNSKGIYNLSYLSSQTISGGSYINLHMPYSYLIFSKENDYYVKRGTDGAIVYKSSFAWGATSAHNSIQYAIDQCTNGGIIYIASGTYNMVDTVTIANKSIQLIGTGWGGGSSGVPSVQPQTILKWPGDGNGFAMAGKYMISCTSTGDSTATWDIKIKNIAFDGLDQYEPRGGLCISNVKHGVFENLYFDDFFGNTTNSYYPKSGIAMMVKAPGAGGCYYNIFRNCRTRRCTVGVFLSGNANGNKFDACHFEGKQGASNHQYGLFLDGADTNSFWGPGDFEYWDEAKSFAVFLNSSQGGNANQFYGVRMEGNYHNYWICNSSNPSEQCGNNYIVGGSCSNVEPGGEVFRDALAGTAYESICHNIHVSTGTPRYYGRYPFISSQKISGGTIKNHMPSSQFRGWLDSVYQESGSIAQAVTYWSSQGAGIYYPGEVRIVPSGVDYGNYRLQVSGNVYFSGNVEFAGAEISGLAAPTYRSGVANKGYVDDISGAIVTHVTNNYYTQTWIDSLSGSIDGRLDTLEAQQPTSWSGAAEFYAVSSLVNTLDTWYDNSSQKYSRAYASAQIAIYEAGSDVAWSGASDFYGFSSNAKSLYQPSGVGAVGDHLNVITLSSQSISGGAFIGGLHYPAEYIIYKDGSNYIAKNASNGKLESTNSDASTVLQYAINNAASGTVFLNTDITNFTYTVTGQAKVILDFGGHNLIEDSNIDYFRMVPDFRVRNGRMKLSGDMRGKAAFKFYNLYNWTNGRYTGIDHMVLEKSINKLSGTAIELHVDSDYGASARGIVGVHIDNVHTQFFEKAYYLHATAATTYEHYVNGNYFNNLQSYCDKYCIMISASAADAQNDCNANIFTNVQVQPAVGYNKTALWCRGEYNTFDGLVIWDWGGSYDDAIYMHSNSQRNWCSVTIGDATYIDDDGYLNNFYDVYGAAMHAKRYYGNGMFTNHYIDMYDGTYIKLYGDNIRVPKRISIGKDINPTENLEVSGNAVIYSGSLYIRGGSVSSQAISGGTIKNHMPSSQFRGWLDSVYQPSGVGAGVGDHLNVISISSQFISSGRITTDSMVLDADTISGLAAPQYPSSAVNKKYVDDISGSIVTHVSNNYYTQTWIDSLSGSIDSRLDTLEGQSDVSWSGASDFYAFSSNCKELYLQSGVTYDLLSANIIKTPLISSSIQIGLKSPSIDIYTGPSLDYVGGFGASIGGGGPLADENYFSIRGPTNFYVEKDDYSRHVLGVYTKSSQVCVNGTSQFWLRYRPENFLVSGDAWTAGYISTQTGIYANFISANNSNLGGTDVAWSGASDFYGFSSNTKSLYQPSGVVPANLSVTSVSAQNISGGTVLAGTLTVGGNQISGIAIPAYNSGIANKKYVDDISGAIIGHISDNYYTQTWIDSLSGSIDTRLDALEGAGDVAWSGASDFYGFSSNAKGLYHPSGFGRFGTIYGTDNITIYPSQTKSIPRITLSGAGSMGAIYYDTSGNQSHYFMHDKVHSFRVNYSDVTKVATLKGPQDNAGDLKICANWNADEAPSITLEGHASTHRQHINLSPNVGAFVRLQDDEQDSIIHLSGTATKGVIAGPDASTNDLLIKANIVDSSPSILLNGNSNIDITGDTKYTGYISTQTGLYAHFISANNSNLSGTDVAWSGASDFYGFSSNCRSLYQPSGVVPDNLSVTSLSSQNISGGSITVGSFTLNANTISGLIDPIYPSAAANKHYVDTISGNLDSKIDSVTDTSWSGASDFYGFSSNCKSLYHPSGYGTFPYISSTTISGNSISTRDIHGDSIDMIFDRSPTESLVISSLSSYGDILRLVQGTPEGSIDVVINPANSTHDFIIHGEERDNVFVVDTQNNSNVGIGMSGRYHNNEMLVVSGNALFYNDMVISGSLRVKNAISSQNISSNIIRTYALHFDDPTTNTCLIHDIDGALTFSIKDNQSVIVYPSGLQILASDQPKTDANGMLWMSGSASHARLYYQTSNTASGFKRVLLEGEGGGSGYWTQTGSDIYYPDGEVRIGHSSFDCGSYKFQVSGDSYFSGSIFTNLGEISGLAAPTYNSGAANKYYVDTAADTYLSGLQDVSITSPASTQALIYNGSQWINAVASGTGGAAALSGLTDITQTSATSGQILTFTGETNKWENKYPPMTYSVANIQISANSNINLARFDTGAGKSCYVWQAYACGSGGTAISGLKVEVLDDDVSIYSTSSQIIQQGSPLAKSDAASSIEIRFMYSGGGALSGYKYGTGMVQVSVY